jgi:hypothetical protein
MMILAEAGGDSSSTVLEVVRSVGPALLALGGVWLGSIFARGREDRSWRRSQTVGACGEFLKAAAAIEQWARSEQFAERLGKGQYPTDYKTDLESLESASALLSISVEGPVIEASERASDAVQEWVNASAKFQANRPVGRQRPAEGIPQGEDASLGLREKADHARHEWLLAREAFISAARNALQSIK